MPAALSTHRERRGRAALELALAYNAKLPGPAARLPLQDSVSRVFDERTLAPRASSL